MAAGRRHRGELRGMWAAGGSRRMRVALAVIAAAVAGCGVLVSGGRTAGVQLGGVGLALLAGLRYAVYAVTAARLISGGTSETTVMGVLFGGAAIVLAPVLAATSPGWVLSGRGLAAAAYLLYGRGLRTVTAPVAVTLGLAEPVVAAVLGVLVPGERLTGPALAGLVLVGVAIAILTVGRPPQTARMSNSPPG
jgi:DME family drug/metabolite transporter